MIKSYYKEYSHSLNRDMEFNVYGNSGQPVLVFPAQDGRFYDFENFNMLDNISDLINEGKIQLFCCDSVDKESWSDVHGDGRSRILKHEAWYNYIVDELVPRIHQINSSDTKIITTGCSMGGTHAANFMFRRPDVFAGVISLSGYFDSDIFFENYCDDLVYNNSPIKFIEGMSYEHYYVDMYRNCKIVLCCGQGAWEDEMLRSIYKMKELLEYKNIPAWIDVWGHDVNHDWNWWQLQLPYFLKHIL